MSFYGDPTIKNLLQFDKIYLSRKAMDEAIANNDDGVFLNRFVFVKYDEKNYDSCRQRDEEYGNIYDGTLWKKVSNGEEVKYELIASLNSSFLMWHTF